jgi:hypothetical protein
MATMGPVVVLHALPLGGLLPFEVEYQPGVTTYGVAEGVAG